MTLAPWRLIPLLALACARAPAATDTDVDPPRAASVVVLGSSTASGWMLDDPATESWVARYGVALTTTAPGSTVTNLAVPGFTTRAIQAEGAGVAPANNITAALALKPDAILVNLPSNDASFGVPIDETMANLHAVATLAHAGGARVAITTSQPRNVTGDARVALDAMRTRVLAEFTGGDELALDFWTPLAADEGTILPALDAGDGVHVNADGQALLAEVAVSTATYAWVTASD